MVPVAVMLRDLVKRGLIQEVDKGKWIRTQTVPPTPTDARGLRVPFRKKHGASLLPIFDCTISPVKETKTCAIEAKDWQNRVPFHKNQDPSLLLNQGCTIFPEGHQPMDPKQKQCAL